MQIEEACLLDNIPVNAKAMLSRLVELLDEHNTNTFLSHKVRKDWRVAIIMIALVQQFFSSTIVLDITTEYIHASDEHARTKEQDLDN